LAIRGMSQAILRMLAGLDATVVMIARLWAGPSSARNPRGVIISNGPVCVSTLTSPAEE
jgi:carbamoylphosphate synthase small subunit